MESARMRDKLRFRNGDLSRPRVVSVSQEGLIKTELLQSGASLPLIIKPAVKDLSLSNWGATNRDFVERQVLKHGAVLFRDFGLNSVADFEQSVRAISGEIMTYHERSSPRHEVSDRIYTSTDYPADRAIFPHNEHSYCKSLPLRLFFFCMIPAQEGGETPIGDCRKIFQGIDPEVRERFFEKKWMYMRNFGDGFGLPWQTVFQTTDKSVVEDYCRLNNIKVEWKSGDRLRTSQVRPVVAIHPRTGEMVWFNHATFFHISTLEPRLCETLLEEFGEGNLPNNTYYGDGSPIEPSVLDHLRDTYRKEMVSFSWQKGDLVMLDNMLTAHSRASFVGPRQILFAMTEPFTRSDF
jgi:alpha-ketoglutarate-dependent taurine dioxygenase